MRRRKLKSLSLIQLQGQCGGKKSARKNTWNQGTPQGSFLIIMPAHNPVKRFDASFISKVLSGIMTFLVLCNDVMDHVSGHVR